MCSLGLPPGSMPLVSAVTWAFVPQRLASSASIRQPRTACRGPEQASEPRIRTLLRLSSAVHCCSPAQVDRLCPSADVAPEHRQSVQSAARAPGVGDEGGPSSPTTLPVSPASLGGSQGHAPDRLKNDSGAGPVTASSLATIVTGDGRARPLRHGPSADRAPRDFLRARENQGGRTTCDAGREGLSSCDVE
jgi:hypothetical protein